MRTRRVVVVFSVLVWTLLVVGVAFRQGRKQIVLRVLSPDGLRIAEVRSHWKVDPPAQSLWLAQSATRAPRRLATLGEDTDWCNQILWSPEGSRVAFLIRGVRLDVYDAATARLTARVPLVPVDGYPGSREARAVKLLARGAGVEFRECMRGKQECSRPKLVKFS
jgi:dipeptidyl aminopeptidase/acylaminoacyl peptidase